MSTQQQAYIRAVRRKLNEVLSRGRTRLPEAVCHNLETALWHIEHAHRENRPFDLPVTYFLDNAVAALERALHHASK